MIRAALRLLATGIFNVVALIVGLILLGIAASFVIWLFGKSYSSVEGFLVYSLLPVVLIGLGSVLWAMVGEDLVDRWRDRRDRD